MTFVIDFLSSPLWQGIQGLLAIAAILFGLGESKKWFEGHKVVEWATKIPWILLLMITGIAVGLGVSIKHQDTYRGLSTVFATLSAVLGLQWIKSHYRLSQANIHLEGEKENLQTILKATWRIISIQQAASRNYAINDHKLVHSIDQEGNDSLYEELVISPKSTAVYFYVKLLV